MACENWKLERDLCRCCHSEGSFKNLAEPFKITVLTDLVEIYADMLKECYEIDMSPVPGMLSAMTYTICEVCIMRLRDAADFKKQVLSCEERFRDMYNKNVIKAVSSVEIEVKQEIPDSEPDDDFKEELSLDDNDDDDYEESMDTKITEDEDEKPVEVEVRKKRKYKPRAVKTAAAKDAAAKSAAAKSAAAKSAAVKNAAVKAKKKTKQKNLKKEPADAENDAESKQDRVEEPLLSADRVEVPLLSADRVEVPLQSTDRVVAPKFYLKKGEDYKKVGDTYHCAKCERTYINLQSMRLHVKSKHYKIPKYKCSICNEDFMMNSPLIEHKLEVHNIDDRFKCNACNKMFNTKKLLTTHTNFFHMLGEVGTRHKCELCDFETFNTRSMKRHKTFTHKNVKDYHCKFCKKSFKRKTTLNFHERIHTGDRRKVCAECGQAFVQKASLNYHMTKYHPEANY